MKKNRGSLKYQWFFQSADTIAIQLHHPEMFLQITKNMEGKITGIAIYDLRQLDMFEERGYVINFFFADQVFYGESRPVTCKDNDVQDANSDEFKWMTLDDKAEMLKLMRRALSYRTSPLPPEFRKIWDEAKKIVEELDIINPGMDRYPQ